MSASVPRWARSTTRATGRDASHLDDVTALLDRRRTPDPSTFETWLREHLQGVSVGDDPRSAGQVTLSTVHRVKGLEWGIA